MRWRFSLHLLHQRKERKGKEVLWLEILLLLNSTAARWPTSALTAEWIAMLDLNSIAVWSINLKRAPH